MNHAANEGAGGLLVVLVRAGGLDFGVPAEQVSRVAQRSLSTPALPEAGADLGAALGLGPALLPTAGALHTPAGDVWRVEAAGDLLPLHPSDLRPLPPLLARRAPRALWGAAMRGAGWLWLLDLDQLEPGAGEPGRS